MSLIGMLYICTLNIISANSMFHTNKKQSLCPEHCKFSEFLSSLNKFSHFTITLLAAVIPSVIPALSNPFKINLFWFVKFRWWKISTIHFICRGWISLNFKDVLTPAGSIPRASWMLTFFVHHMLNLL